MQEAMINTGERERLRELLDGRPLRRLRLPAALEQDYLAHHREVALDQVASWWWTLLPTLALIAVFLFGFGVLPPGLYFTVAVGLVIFLAMILVIAVTALDPRLRSHLPGVLAVIALAAMVMTFSTTLLAPAGDRLHVLSSVSIVLMIVIIFAFSSLPFRHAAATVLLAYAIFSVTAFAIGGDVDWRELAMYSGAAFMVGLLTSFSQESRERIVFLQARALMLEKQIADTAAFQLEQLSRTDSLTGLFNRRHFEETLAREFAVALRDGSPLGVVLIDVDHFKAYNDRYGHPAGDECLARVGRALSSQFARASDVVARYGGEEFVVILPRSTPESIESACLRLRQSVGDLAMTHEGSSCANIVTVSVGAALGVPAAGDAASGLLKRADDALYEAKRQGRNRHVFSKYPVAAG